MSPVSYTHLDVYKRQRIGQPSRAAQPPRTVVAQTCRPVQVRHIVAPSRIAQPSRIGQPSRVPSAYRVSIINLIHTFYVMLYTFFHCKSSITKQCKSDLWILKWYTILC